MSPLESRLAAIEQRLANATPGPWYSHHCMSGKKTDCWCKVVGTSPAPTDMKMDDVVASGSTGARDAELIAHAPEDLRRLIACVRRADEKLAEFGCNCGADIDSENSVDECASCEARAELVALLSKGEG